MPNPSTAQQTLGEIDAPPKKDPELEAIKKQLNENNGAVRETVLRLPALHPFAGISTATEKKIAEREKLRAETTGASRTFGSPVADALLGVESGDTDPAELCTVVDSCKSQRLKLVGNAQGIAKSGVEIAEQAIEELSPVAEEARALAESKLQESKDFLTKHGYGKDNKLNSKSHAPANAKEIKFTNLAATKDEYQDAKDAADQAESNLNSMKSARSACLRSVEELKTLVRKLTLKSLQG